MSGLDYFSSKNANEFGRICTALLKILTKNQNLVSTAEFFV